MEKNKMVVSGKALRKPAVIAALLLTALSLSACVVPVERGFHDGGRSRQHWNNDGNWNGGRRLAGQWRRRLEPSSLRREDIVMHAALKRTAATAVLALAAVTPGRLRARAGAQLWRGRLLRRAGAGLCRAALQLRAALGGYWHRNDWRGGGLARRRLARRRWAPLALIQIGVSVRKLTCGALLQPIIGL